MAELCESGDVGSGECVMGDSDSSDDDIIGPPLPPGFGKKLEERAGSSGLSEGRKMAGNEDSEEEEEDEKSVSYYLQ